MDIALSNGMVLTTWTTSLSSTGSSWADSSPDLRGQLFTSDGTASGGTFAINVKQQVMSDVVSAHCLSDDRVVIVWSTSDGDHGEDVFARVISMDGTSLGSDLVVANGPGGIENLLISLDINDLLTASWTNIADGGEPLGPGATAINLQASQMPELGGSDIATFTIDPSFTGSLIDFTAVDDSGDTENGGGLTYSITKGNTGGYLAIDASTGELSVVKLPSAAASWAEAVNGVIVRVTDSDSNYDEKRIEIRLADAADKSLLSTHGRWSDAAALTLVDDMGTKGSIKAGDILVEHTATGHTPLHLGGDDAGSFEIVDGPDGPELWYSGGDLDSTLQSQFSVSVIQGDETDASTTENTSWFTLHVSDAVSAGTTGNDDFLSTALAEIFSGSAGIDSVSYEQASAGVSANLDNPSENSGGALGDVYLSVENLKGSQYADHLVGNSLNNVISGAGGADSMNGGYGNDTFGINCFGDTVSDASKFDDDWVTSFSLHLNLTRDKLKNVENARLFGENDLNLTGNASGNELIGNRGDNRVCGGDGQDILTGGQGADTFTFKAISKGGASYDRDRITDFKHGVDTLDFSAIDANGGAEGNTAFHLTGAQSNEFSGARGELIWQQAGNLTMIMADVNGDKKADLLIWLDGTHQLDANDFIL